MSPSENKSVADLISSNLTTRDKAYVENYNFKLMHEVLLKCIESGVSGEVIRTVITYIPRETVANTIGTNVKNFNRLTKKNLKMYQADMLIDLSCVWCELRQFFSFDESSLRQWVCTPLPALAGVSPELLLESIAGRNELRKLLKIMRSGDL